jgi:hypothetical protein
VANASDYLEGQIRAHIFRTASFTKPTALWVGLFTVTPSDSGGGTEVTGGSYARVNQPPLDANWTAASSTDGITTNATVITFPAPTANWGSVLAFGIFDASTSGNLFVWGPISPAKTINASDPQPSFAIGALSVTVA